MQMHPGSLAASSLRHAKLAGAKNCRGSNHSTRAAILLRIHIHTETRGKTHGSRLGSSVPPPNELQPTAFFRRPNPLREEPAMARSALAFTVAAIMAGTSAAALAGDRAQPGDDTSGRIQRGRASYYHPRFNGRKMANGERFDIASNSAASRTLPLGTVAQVRNLETGQTAIVDIEDRGPYVGGRVIDVSPHTADVLGMKQDGVVPVEVAPIEVPQRDGSVKPGAGARTASR
jgi:rare lipoprotein A